MQNLIFYVVVWNDSANYHGLCPDFSVMSGGQTSIDGVLQQIQVLVDAAVAQSQSLGQPLPKATSLSVLQSKWTGDYQFLGVSVSI